MRALEYEVTEDLRSIDRSQYRSLPSDCVYCGYRSRPSSSVDSCCSYCHTNYNKLKISKRWYFSVWLSNNMHFHAYIFKNLSFHLFDLNTPHLLVWGVFLFIDLITSNIFGIN